MNGLIKKVSLAKKFIFPDKKTYYLAFQINVHMSTQKYFRGFLITNQCFKKNK